METKGGIKISNIYKCNGCSHECEVRKEVPGIPQLCLMVDWGSCDWRKISLKDSLWS